MGAALVRASRPFDLPKKVFRWKDGMTGQAKVLIALVK